MTTSPPTFGPHSSVREIRAQLARAQKSNRGAPAWSRWVNRPAGRTIAALAFRAGWTPNQVTVLSASITAAGLALLAFGPASVPVGIGIALLLALGFALDAADGQLARLRGGGSAVGEWLDHVVDGTKTAVIHLLVLVGWYRHYDLDDRWLLVPLAFAVEASVFFFAIILTEQLRRSARGAVPSTLPRTDEPAPVLRSILVAPADYGVLCVTFALWGWQTGFVAVYTLLMVANVGFLLGALPRWYREMSALS